MDYAFPLVRTTRPTSAAERSAAVAEPGFGRYFTDHMASAVWTPNLGWHDRRVGPLEPFTLHPAAAVLHYAQEIFEGLKAYRHPDDGIRLFRPECNARRFARSAERMCLPPLPEEDFLASVEVLTRADELWVPEASGERSLYIRPFMFAAETFLGVRPAERVIYGVVACPVQPYFPSGVDGVKLWVTTSYRRASEGGTGATKCGGNYGASLAPQVEAERNGCDQVLYLDGVGEDACIEESGAMNLFLVTSTGELITPSLGTILAGVTRDTILTLAPEFGLAPVERAISFAELSARVKDGSIIEAFAAGTAAVLAPVTEIRGKNISFKIRGGEAGSRTVALRKEILGIQYGQIEDKHGWLRNVD